jgi:hypothetical protein
VELEGAAKGCIDMSKRSRQIKHFLIFDRYVDHRRSKKCNTRTDWHFILKVGTQAMKVGLVNIKWSSIISMDGKTVANMR